MSRPRAGAFTVSGAGEDRAGYESAGVALSAAITFAGCSPVEVTVYVRDATGAARGRVERDEHGCLAVYGERHYTLDNPRT